MLVKICGLRRIEDAEAAVEAGADLIGVVLVPGTARAVTVEEVSWIRRFRAVETVGVFRDAPLETMLEVRRQLNLDWVQLHGDEPDEMVEGLGSGVIRRLPAPGDSADRRRAEMFIGMGARLLIDPGAGDGRSCEWRVVGRTLDGLPFGLAGGLGPDNVEKAVREARPTWVDVSSGVEAAPGIKDHNLLRLFVARARGTVDDVESRSHD